MRKEGDDTPPSSTVSWQNPALMSSVRDLFGREIVEGVIPLDSWEIASRLSFTLLDSMPDEGLMALAETAALTDPAQVAQEARRLLADPRGVWLERVTDPIKESAFFPECP